VTARIHGPNVVVVAKDDPSLVIRTLRVQADYDSSANAISIKIADAAHAEGSVGVHPRAIVAISDGKPV